LHRAAPGSRKAISAIERPDAAGGGDPPDPTGVPAVLAMACLFVIVLAIVGLVALGGWVAFAGAVVLMVGGVIFVARYVEHVSVTSRAGAAPDLRSWRVAASRNGDEGSGGTVEDLAVTDDARSEVSVHDVPLDNPERHAIAERDASVPRRARVPRTDRREPVVRRGEVDGRPDESDGPSSAAARPKRPPRPPATVAAREGGRRRR
jgi:hypothetical protein